MVGEGFGVIRFELEYADFPPSSKMLSNLEYGNETLNRIRMTLF